MVKKAKYWSLLASSRRGATHRHNGVVNQDALSAEKVGEGIVVAVADGHGSPSSPQSHTGAHFAVEVACEQLRYFAERNAAVRNYQSLNDLAAKVPAAIVHEWRMRVDEQRDILAEHKAKISSSMLSATEEQSEDLHLLFERERVRSVRRLFGTTLLAAVLTKRWVLLLQLGDGDILWVYENEAVVEVVPVWQSAIDELVGEDTHSLCEDNAESLMQWKIVPVEPQMKLLLLSTDGYSKSFSTRDGFYKAAVDWYRLLREYGAEELQKHMDNWLDETSAEGCGDDITVALVYRTAAPQPLIKRLRIGGLQR